MATLTITITAGATTYGTTKTLSSTDLTRLITAYTALFGTAGDNNATGLAWAQQLMAVTQQTVAKYEETQAVEAARAGVTTITLT